jgi:hypothetical protein
MNAPRPFGPAPRPEGARKRRPYGALGVFLVVLGAGVILDADLTGAGWLAILVGVACLVAESRQAVHPS